MQPEQPAQEQPAKKQPTPEEILQKQRDTLAKLDKDMGALLNEHSIFLSKTRLQNDDRAMVGALLGEARAAAQAINTGLDNNPTPNRQQVMRFHDAMREASEILQEIGNTPIPKPTSAQPGSNQPSQRAKDQAEAVKKMVLEARQIRSKVDGMASSMHGAGMQDPLKAPLKTPEQIQDYAIVALKQVGNKAGFAVMASPTLKSDIDGALKSAGQLLNSEGKITDESLKAFQDAVAKAVKAADDVSKVRGQKPDIIKEANQLESALNSIKIKVTNAVKAGAPKEPGKEATEPQAPEQPEQQPENNKPRLRAVLAIGEELRKLEVPNYAVMNKPGIKEGFTKISGLATTMINLETDEIIPDEAKKFNAAIDETRTQLNRFKKETGTPKDQQESADRLIKALDEIQQKARRELGLAARDGTRDHDYASLVPDDLRGVQLASASVDHQGRPLDTPVGNKDRNRYL